MNSSSSTEPSYRMWYRFEPPPDDGQISNSFMKLKVSGLPPGISLDYAAVQTRSGATAEKPVIVDDTDEHIIYTGSWSTPRTTYPTDMTHGRIAEPYGPGVHESRTIGDRVFLTFAGTSIAAHGIVNPGELVSLSISVDGKAPEIYSYSSETARHNSQLFLIDNLLGRSHTLSITLVKLPANRTFVLDSFITNSFVRNIANIRSGPADQECVVFCVGVDESSIMLTLITLIPLSVFCLILATFTWVKWMGKKRPQALKKLVRTCGSSLFLISWKSHLLTTALQCDLTWSSHGTTHARGSCDRQCWISGGGAMRINREGWQSLFLRRTHSGKLAAPLVGVPSRSCAREMQM